jgi:hypothetical protein
LADVCVAIFHGITSTLSHPIFFRQFGE